MNNRLKEGYFRSVGLIGFSDLVRGKGGDPEHFFRRAGLPVEALHDTDLLLPYRRFTTMFEWAAAELESPHFGLEWTASIPDHFPNIGPVVLLASVVNNVREWSEVGLRYWSYHTNGFTFDLIESDETPHATFRMRMQAVAFPGRQSVEHAMGNLCRMVPIVAGHPHEKPVLIRFQHTRSPQDSHLYEQIFRCPVEFNCLENEIVFERRQLDLETRGNLSFFKPLLGYYVQYRIARVPVYDQSFSTVVALAIPSVIGAGLCNLEGMAAALQMNPKKMQRQLAEEGTTFSEILDSVRERLARNMLTKSDAAIEKIAGLLEYSSNAAFTTAFRRWTGRTPLEFRQNEQRHRVHPAPALSRSAMALHRNSEAV